MKCVTGFFKGKSSSQRTSLEFSPRPWANALVGGDLTLPKYLGKRTCPVENYKMVGFGMGEGLHGRAFAIVKIIVGS
jgi:hypothetical protein